MTCTMSLTRTRGSEDQGWFPFEEGEGRRRVRGRLASETGRRVRES